MRILLCLGAEFDSYKLVGWHSDDGSCDVSQSCAGDEGDPKPLIRFQAKGTGTVFDHPIRPRKRLLSFGVRVGSLLNFSAVILNRIRPVVSLGQSDCWE